MFKKQTTIGKYLIDRLYQAGVEDIFGIPGDYVVKFFSAMEKSSIRTVGTSTEQGAAFAADSYARVNGIGALCVTYCVGGLNTVNAVAGAYAEKAPLIVISGAPGVCERDSDYLLHHSIRDINSQLNIFKEITIAQARLDNPQSAPYEINRVIAACLEHKRPVYIELPRDMVDEKCHIPPESSEVKCEGNQNTLKEALNESFEMLEASKKPIIVAGVEIKRYGLEEEFLKLLEKTGFPYVTTILGKAVVDESHEQFMGVYMGKVGNENVRRYIEESDCILMLGALMTDTNMGTAQLDVSKTIYATADQLCIKHHCYKNVVLKSYIEELTKVLDKKVENIVINNPVVSEFQPEKETKITIKRFFEKLDSVLPESSMVICDIGDSLFGSVDLHIPKDSVYLGPAYYTSMGYAIPACLGAKIKENKYKCPIIIVGDGAFQMSSAEISSFVRYGITPIIFVLNNKGYTTQRFLKDGNFNEIHEWNYHLIPEVLGEGNGYSVHSEEDLENAVSEAMANQKSYSIINVHLEKYDKSSTLDKLTKYLGKNI